MQGNVPKRRLPLITLHPPAGPRMRGPTCVDLFSGAGGLAEGFRQAGWSLLAANDDDSHAAQTFRLNFPEASFFEGSVAALDPAALLKETGLARGELDCLIGGPPCQSFSYNNHRRSATDQRAQLFRKYLRIVEALLPKTLVMENVPGMLTIGDGKIVDEIKKKLGRLGYECDVGILYSEDFGVPQTRRRAFILATRLGKKQSLLPRGTHGPSAKPSPASNKYVHRWQLTGRQKPKAFVTVWDAIGDLPRLKNGAGQSTSKYKKDPSTTYQRIVRGRAPDVTHHVCHALSKSMVTRIAHVPEGGNWRSIPRRLLPAGMRRAKPKDHTKRYGRLRRNGLASTILTKCDPHWGAYIHPTQERTISVREAARLQGFPDSFAFATSHIGKHYEQVGNAVPVQMALALGRKLRAHIRRRRSPRISDQPQTLTAKRRMKDRRYRRTALRHQADVGSLRKRRHPFARPERRRTQPEAPARA